MKKFIKVKNKILIFILTILGFSASIGSVVAQYGVPPASFTLLGVVRDADTKEVISNVMIKANEYETTKTDSNGRFILERHTYTNKTTFYLNIKAAKFEQKDTIVVLTDSISKSRWNFGGTEQIEILLEKKK